MSTLSINPMDPNRNPQGSQPTDLTKGPGAAYVHGGEFVPQPIGQVPTPPGTIHIIDQNAINKAIADSQQGKPVQINLPWLLAQPDSPSKQGLVEIVAILNRMAGA